MLKLTLPLHHAYCILGDRKKVAEQILRALELSVGFVARGNPDYWFGEYQMLSIDEARTIKEMAGRSAIAGDRKIFLLAAYGMAKETQNALLKIFEEPVSGTHFFLILPTAETLLPTLISRMLFIDCRGGGVYESEEAVAFLKAALPIRIKKAQALLKKAETDESGTEKIIIFLNVLERLIQKMKNEKEGREAIEQLFLSKKYCRDRSRSFKLILEHLALVLPTSMKHET